MRRVLIACSLVLACAGPNYYDVLGVGPRATTEQIRTAWKAAALRHHPDKNPKDPERGGAHEAHQHGEGRPLRPGEAPGARRRAPSAARGGRARRVQPSGGARVREPFDASLLLLAPELGGFRPFPKLVAAQVWVPTRCTASAPDAVLGAVAALDPTGRARGGASARFALYGRRYVVDFELAEAPHARFRRVDDDLVLRRPRALVVAGAAARRPRGARARGGGGRRRRRARARAAPRRRCGSAACARARRRAQAVGALQRPLPRGGAATVVAGAGMPGADGRSAARCGWWSSRGRSARRSPSRRRSFSRPPCASAARRSRRPGCRAAAAPTTVTTAPRSTAPASPDAAETTAFGSRAATVGWRITMAVLRTAATSAAVLCLQLLESQPWDRSPGPAWGGSSEPEWP